MKCHCNRDVFERYRVVLNSYFTILNIIQRDYLGRKKLHVHIKLLKIFLCLFMYIQRVPEITTAVAKQVVVL